MISQPPLNDSETVHIFRRSYYFVPFAFREQRTFYDRPKIIWLFQTLIKYYLRALSDNKISNILLFSYNIGCFIALYFVCTIVVAMRQITFMFWCCSILCVHLKFIKWKLYGKIWKICFRWPNIEWKSVQTLIFVLHFNWIIEKNTMIQFFYYDYVDLDNKIFTVTK